MKVVPQYVYEEISNYGERLVFDLLERLECFGEDAFAMHSLNIVGRDFKRLRKRFFENDFLVVTKNSLISIEVKSGAVALIDGQWCVYKKDGRTLAYEPKKESPYTQAQRAGYAYRKWLIEHGCTAAANLEVIPVAVLCSNYRDTLKSSFGVIPELELSYVISADELKPDIFEDRLKKIEKQRLIEVDNHFKGMASSDFQSILDYTRPNVELSFPNRKRLILREQDKFTGEQLNYLDMFSLLDRFICDGGAGTGKTFLLEHLVRSDLRKGKEVAVVTSPELLANKLKESFVNENVGVYTYKSLLNEEKKYDSLFIDESQDFLTSDRILDVFKLLEDDMECGRWGMFGDFQNQKHSDVVMDDELLKDLISYTNASKLLPLKRNVRNTPEIVAWLEKNCLARIGETESAGYGIEVSFRSLLEAKLDLKNRGAFDENSDVLNTIAIFPRAITLEDKKNILESLDGLISESDLYDEEEFKGLEAETVYVLGLNILVEKEWIDYLYKSVSRARAVVKVVVEDPPEARKKIRRMVKNAK